MSEKKKKDSRMRDYSDVSNVNVTSILRIDFGNMESLTA